MSGPESDVIGPERARAADNWEAVYFEPLRPSGEEILAAVNPVTEALGELDDLAAQFNGNLGPALTAAYGEIAEGQGLPATAEPANRQHQDADRFIAYGAALARLHAGSVTKFNETSAPYPRSIRQLNHAVNDDAVISTNGGVEYDQDALAALEHEHALLVANYQADEAIVVQMAEGGPDNQDYVRAVFAFGALSPQSLQQYFPEVTASPNDWKFNLLFQADRSALTMEDLDLIPAEYISDPVYNILNDPEVAEVAGPLLQEHGQEIAQQLVAADWLYRSEFDELFRDLDRYGTVESFGSGFTSELSADDLAGIAIALNEAPRNVASADPDRQILDESLELYGDRLSAIATTLATGTRAMSASNAYDYAQEWVDVIARDPHAEEAPGLASLLRYGEYSTPFWDHLSTEVYEIDRRNGGIWAWNEEPDVAGDELDSFILPDGQETIDVLSSVLVGLGNNPEAAQNFLEGAGTDLVHVDGVGTMDVYERLDYLINERLWVPDEDGYGLGEALEAATTELRGSDGPGYTSAEIASQATALIGAHEMESDDVWTPPRMQDNVRNILNEYAYDVHFGLYGLDGQWVQDPPPGFPSLAQDGAYGAQMDPNHVDALFRMLGRNEEHVQQLHAALTIAADARLNGGMQLAIQTHSDAPVLLMEGVQVPDVRNAAVDVANAYGRLVDRTYDGMIAAGQDAEEDQQRREVLAATAIDIAGSIPAVETALRVNRSPLDFDPEGFRTELYSYVGIRELADALVQYNDEQSASSVGEAVNSGRDLDTATQDDVRNMVLNYMLVNGWFDQQYVDRANSEVGGTLYGAPPSGALTHDDAGNLVFDVGSRAYDDWLDEGGAPVEVADQAAEAYASAFSNSHTETPS